MSSLKSLILIVITSLMATSGCNLKVIPLQMVRLSQQEVYVQTYKFEKPGDASKVMQQILGDKNHRNLVNLLSLSLEDELESGNIEAKGMFWFNLSLVASNPNQFFIDGVGKYFLVWESVDPEEKGRILYTGDFHLVQNKYEIKDQFEEIDDMEDGVLSVSFRQFAISVSTDDGSYFHDALIDVDFNMDMRFAEDNMYMIDYSVPHRVTVEGAQVGFLHFDKPEPGDEMNKIIDLRGIDYLRDDYAEIYQKRTK